jgi:hypothetical protein
VQDEEDEGTHMTFSWTFWWVIETNIKQVNNECCSQSEEYLLQTISHANKQVSSNFALLQRKLNFCTTL